MSLDLWLEETFEVNLTYNYSQMWAKAMGDQELAHDPPVSFIKPTPDKCFRLVEVDDLTGRESIPIFDKAIDAMEADMPSYRALNPANGWGNADLLLKRLKECRQAAKEHPDTRWSAHR